MPKRSLFAALLFSTMLVDASAHDQHAAAPGGPGDAANVTRTVEISMKETADGKMLFEPASLSATSGETLRFVLRNDGEGDHEFILGDAATLAEHGQMMQEFPDMHHNDGGSVRLAPGQSGEIVWTFGTATEMEFACLIPGHYEAGMHGKVSITAR